MDHPLNVYGYHVRYGHSTNNKINKINEGVCFSTLFSSSCKSKYYRIIILKGDADLNSYYSNFCFFNKKEIKNHLKQIPNFCKIKYSVKDVEYEGKDAFQLDIYINSNNRLIHKYILTWVRGLFEWPFYLYLLHAKKLQTLPQFKFESVVNLFNVVATVHRNSFNTNIHTFGVNLALCHKSNIIENVKHKNSVNAIFDTHYIKNIPQCNLINNFSEITDKLYEDNLPKYLEAYELIKNENNNNRK